MDSVVCICCFDNGQPNLNVHFGVNVTAIGHRFPRRLEMCVASGNERTARCLKSYKNSTGKAVAKDF